MSDTPADRADAVSGMAAPSPLVEREVEPETLVATVERELTVIPDAEGEPEPQADPNRNRSGGENPVEVEVEGVAEPRVGTPEGATSATTPEAPAGDRTHGRLRTWVIVSTILLGLATMAFASTYTPLFAADTVRVEGAERLSAAQVRRIAKVQPGVNVFRLDARQVERRLERNAWIADAAVTKRLPSSVTIAIRERAPAAVVATDASGGRSIVAADGTILAPASDTVALPLVEAADGAMVPTEGQRTVGAEVAGALPPAVVHRVEAVRAWTDGSVEIILTDGVRVSYGGSTALAQKGQALRAVLGWAERHGVHLESIDVTSPGAPTASLAGGGPIIGNPWQR